MTARRNLIGPYILIALGVIAIIIGTFEIGLPDPHASVKNHHIQHVFYILGGSFLGLAIGRALTIGRSKEQWPGSGWWLAPAIAVSAVVMAAMWPSTYPFIEANPLIHAIQHGFYIALSFVAVVSGYMFAKSAGWLSGVMLTVMAWGAAFGFGVTPGPSPLIAAVDEAQLAQVSTATVADGAVVYANCQACHQQDGNGMAGVFPPLNNHIPDVLAAAGGREYLVDVLLYGVQGPFSISGVKYNSVMPAWPQLSDAEIAAVLNHISTSWDNELPSNQEPFAASEITDARGLDIAATDVLKKREALLLAE